MDFIVNLRTFLAVGRLGSFSAAAREIGTVPSVVSKRVSQLEHMCRAPLFVRSTRGLELTPVGRSCQQKFAELLSEIEAMVHARPQKGLLFEHIRIKCPTAPILPLFTEILCDFQTAHPGVRIDLDIIDRSVNPVEEGYDIALGALPATYPHVHDVMLCPLRRCAVAAPGYLETHPKPEHPRDLSRLDALVYRAAGNIWTFAGPSGELTVEVNAVFTSSDSRILQRAAVKGLGVAVMSETLAREGIEQGSLVEILPGWRVPDLQLKAMVPERRLRNAAVRLLLDAFVAATAPEDSGVQL